MQSTIGRKVFTTIIFFVLINAAFGLVPTFLKSLNVDSNIFVIVANLVSMLLSMAIVRSMMTIEIGDWLKVAKWLFVVNLIVSVVATLLAYASTTLLYKFTLPILIPSEVNNILQSSAIAFIETSIIIFVSSWLVLRKPNQVVNTNSNSNSKVAGGIFLAIVFAILLWILYSAMNHAEPKRTTINACDLYDIPVTLDSEMRTSQIVFKEIMDVVPSGSDDITSTASCSTIITKATKELTQAHSNPSDITIAPKYRVIERAVVGCKGVYACLSLDMRLGDNLLLQDQSGEKYLIDAEYLDWGEAYYYKDGKATTPLNYKTYRECQEKLCTE